MRYFVWLLLLTACSAKDRVAEISPGALYHHEVTFEPLTREQAERYLKIEKHNLVAATKPMKDKMDALQRGRDERYAEVSKEFPECRRTKHCLGKVTLVDTNKLERFNDLTKEIHRYDVQLVELEASIRDWTNRFQMRQRAILNRFLVHELLEIPKLENRFQSIMVYSLESFDNRKELSNHLLRYSGEGVSANLVGDYDFRMLGRPIDEAAVIATLEVYLMPPLWELDQPTRYVVRLLVNTHQLDFYYYDKTFLRLWADKLTEPRQNKIRSEAFCSFYSIAGETLAPRLDPRKAKSCAPERTLLQMGDVDEFGNRFPPQNWVLPLGYAIMKKSE